MLLPIRLIAFRFSDSTWRIQSYVSKIYSGGDLLVISITSFVLTLLELLLVYLVERKILVAEVCFQPLQENAASSHLRQISTNNVVRVPNPGRRRFTTQAYCSRRF